MLKTLVKKQLMEIFRSYFYNAKTNQKRSKNAVVGYIVLFAAVMIVIIGGMFTVMSLALCVPLAQAGMSWLYFAIMSLMAAFLGAFGSVFNTYAGLYAAKDNDLLLSLPIPVRTLMASRLLGVYLMGLMYAAVGNSRPTSTSRSAPAPSPMPPFAQGERVFFSESIVDIVHAPRF